MYPQRESVLRKEQFLILRCMHKHRQLRLWSLEMGACIERVNGIEVFMSFLVSFIVASQLAERSTRIPTLPITLSGNTGRC